ncbi:MAG: PAS domain-containing protein [Anaerolineales bacterium]|nr:PAS domain-containing protein [Anaerolineales bacterium]
MTTLLHLTPYLASLSISLAVGAYAWQHRQVAGARYFALYALFQASWTIGYVLELGTPSLQGKVLWDDFQFIGFIYSGAPMIIFALIYTGRPIKSTRRLWFWLSIVPVVSLALVVTNAWHGIVRGEAWLVEDTPFDVLYYDFTPAIFLMGAYAIGQSLYVLVALAHYFFKSQYIYRRQVATIFVGGLIPVLGGFATFGGLTLSGQRDVAPVTFALGNVVVAWGLFRYRLFDLVPIARDMVLENMVDGVLVLDRERRIVDHNPTFLRMLRLSKPVIGKKTEMAFSDWPDLLNRFGPLDQARERIEVPREDGVIAHIDVDITPLTDQHQQKIGRLIVLRNVTEQVEFQRALEQQKSELEKLNTELQVAWDAAKAADRVKSQFLANTSHELRTPLNAILNFAQFLAMDIFGEINDQQRDAVDKIIGSGKHLLALINDILDITKIEAGMMHLFIEDNINLHQELTSVLASVETMLVEKPIRLVTDIDAELPTMVGDRRRIRQILLNLLSNAAKFTAEGSITLSIKKRQTDILFMVSDTGPGIAEEDQQIIFEPFRQTEIGVRQMSGTGLGLPITMRLVEAHHGKLWLESEMGEGSSFFFTLPVQSEALLELMKTEAEV